MRAKAPRRNAASVSREIAVARKEPPRPRAGKSVWPINNAWNRANENLYSAWIEKLFDAPLDEAPSWKAMHDVLRDPSRNVLFNHLGLREDQKGHVIQPDCADVPYFLRAYFAFKMGLPFGYAKCTRGDGGQPPRCQQWWNIVKEEPPPEPLLLEQQMARVPSWLVRRVRTRSAATAVDARDKSDKEAARARAGLRILPEDDACRCRAFR